MPDNFNNNINTSRQTGLNVKIDNNVSRQTPKTDFGSQLNVGLNRAANVASAALPWVPGGAVLSAAIQSGRSAVYGMQGSTGLSTGATGTTMGAMGSTSSGFSPNAVNVTGGGYTPGGGGVPGAGGAPLSNDPASLMAATRQMQEMQQSFNMQYLMLQQQMQQEQRQWTVMSNIMKTKHDTVKNTISNIRG